MIAKVVSAFASRTTDLGSFTDSRAALYEDTAVKLAFYIDASSFRSVW